MGDWRLLAQSDAGSFGVVYLAVRVGDEAAGPCALKLARTRGDARLRREVELLGRVSHPNVPRLHGHGEWYGFPYAVMDWVEGATPYRWAKLCNPTRREVTRLLGKVAGALAAVHAMGGVHRDMKGENVLVRLADNEPFLTDFGAGTWEGAAPVTVEGPPGTPQYYSPERLRAHLNLLPPGAPHRAGPADDVYGLGVTAYRLLTLVFERLRARPWNPTAWTLSRTTRPSLPRPTDALLTGLAVAGLILLIARERWLAHRPSIEMPAEVAQQAPEDEDRDGGVVGLGDTPRSTPASVASLEPVRGNIGVDMPKKPLPGQRRPPCKKPTVEIHGGCWVGPIEEESPPCSDQSYEWKNRCYWPFMAPGHPPTSDER